MGTMFARPRRGYPRRLTDLRVLVALIAISALGAPGADRLEAGGTRPTAAGATGSGTRPGVDAKGHAPGALDTPEPEPLDPRVQVLSDRYREIFATLALADRTTALERAITLETQALAANPKKAIEWLSQADRVLLDEFVLVEPRCALPLAIFYQRLVLAHAAKMRHALTQRAERVAEKLFDEMSLAAHTADERHLTATAYAGFAAELLTLPAPSRAAEMLSRGLLLVPDDVDANLALAVLLLRDRRPAAAAVRLDRVIGAHPENREAQLRRALLRAGFSADGRAARELETLAAAKETDWVTLIAVQERARRFLVAGKYEQAIAFLNGACERFPSESSLRVALAFAAARSGRRTEAQSAIDTAMAVEVTHGESARRRFGELPIRLLLPNVARAEAAAAARTANLAAAVSGAGATSALERGPAAAGRLR